MDAGGMTSFRSILDKPLKDLTEDDISQLTREDCRNFLKLKGMRRPSWNKSQAIQQVICLKALLESTDDSGASALRKITANQLQVWTYLCLGIFLEVLAAVFEQLSSTKKPEYALFALLFSIVGLSLCIFEVVHKIWQGGVKLRRRNNIYWLFHPPNYDKPFGSFIDFVGLTYAIFQSLTSIIQS